MASIRKRGETFTITAYMGYDEQGKQRKKTTTFRPPDGITAGKAEKLAKAFAATWEEKIRGYVALDENRTFRELADWYYKVIAPNTLKPNILIAYRQGIENHIMPRIGREKLKNITPPMLDNLFRELSTSGNMEQSYLLKNIALFDSIKREEFCKKAQIDKASLYKVLRGGTCRRLNAEKIAAGLKLPFEKVFDNVTQKRGLSGSTVNKLKLNLSAIFTAAVKKEIMRRNPCTLVTTPKIDTPPASFLNEEQSRILLNVLHNQDDFQLEVIVNLFLATGIRAGELTGLHWDNINLKTGILQVQYTLTRYNGQFVRQVPKTEQSKRRIVLPPYIINLLSEHKKRQQEYINSLGTVSLYQGQVFTNLHGDYINHINLNVRLKRVAKVAGLPDIHLHSLRHTHASLLINSDITAKVIADRLGHAQTKTTLDTYSHVFAESEIKTMQAVEMKLFDKAPMNVTK